jgi:hypothetical protein
LVSAAFAPDGDRADAAKYQSYALQIANADRVIASMSAESADIALTIAEKSARGRGRERLSKVTPEDAEKAVKNLAKEHEIDKIFKDPVNMSSSGASEGAINERFEALKSSDDKETEELQRRFELLKGLTGSSEKEDSEELQRLVDKLNRSGILLPGERMRMEELKRMFDKIKKK